MVLVYRHSVVTLKYLKTKIGFPINLSSFKNTDHFTVFLMSSPKFFSKNVSFFLLYNFSISTSVKFTLCGQVKKKHWAIQKVHQNEVFL